LVTLESKMAVVYVVLCFGWVSELLNDRVCV